MAAQTIDVMAKIIGKGGNWIYFKGRTNQDFLMDFMCSIRGR